MLKRVKQQNVPSEEVFAYADRYKWGEEGARDKLAPSLRNSRFFLLLLPKLHFRPLSVDEAVSYLAEDAGAPPEYKDQLLMLIEYLRTARLINVEGKTITAVDEPDVSETLENLPNEAQAGPGPSTLGSQTLPKLINNAESFDLDPLILALLRKIPTQGNEWTAEKRLRWFKTFAMNVSQVYDQDSDPVELQILIEKQ